MQNNCRITQKHKSPANTAGDFPCLLIINLTSSIVPV